jgi:4-hydroxybenzoate polyprenyltransferase/membrane protein implicated in regulation of membrane protease activity
MHKGAILFSTSWGWVKRFLYSAHFRFGLSTFWHSLFYLVIVILCLLAGGVANPHFNATDLSSLFSTINHVLDARDPRPTVWMVIIFFFCYFIIRLAVLDRPPDFNPSGYSEGALRATRLLLPLVYVVYCGGFLYGAWVQGNLGSFWLPFAVTFPSVVMFAMAFPRFKKKADEKGGEVTAQQVLDDPQGHRFLPKIFYPAFSTCFMTFLMGWGAISPRSPLVILGMTKAELIYCLFSAAITFLYLVSRWKDSLVAVAIAFIIFLPTTFAVSVLYYDAVGLSLVIALLWTFALGVAEVAKRGRLLHNNEVRAGNGETYQFYVMGANWSSILFYNLLLLLPIIVPTTPMLLIVAPAWGALAAWHLLQEKTSRKAYWSAVVIGYAVPIGITLLLLWGKFQGQHAVPELDGLEHQTDRVITLLGVFLTITFVLYHDDYRMMPSELRGQRSEWFLYRRNCLLFAALVVAVEAVLITAVFSILSLSPQIVSATGVTLDQLQTQLDIVLLLLTAELVTVFVWLFVERDDRPARNKKRSKGKTSAKPSPKNDGTTGLAGFVTLTRPIMSFIAGLLAFVTFYQLTGSVSSSIGVLFCTVCVCMFGYIANDILDVAKDQAANRDDKLIAVGQISTRQAVMLASALALIALCVGTFYGNRFFVTIVISLTLAFGYSHFSRLVPKLKGLYTGVLCCLPIIIGFSGNVFLLNGAFAVMVLLFIFGREILIDVTDMEYDKQSAHNTIALALGRRNAILLGWIVMLASTPLALLAEVNLVGKVLVIAAAGFLAATILFFGFRNVERAIVLTRIPMLLFICSLLFTGR